MLEYIQKKLQTTEGIKMVSETEREAREMNGALNKYIQETYIIACQELCGFEEGICFPAIHPTSPFFIISGPAK